ncbi:hypothetical protein HK098_001488 [Nowakowskiella sp. JEL0407]|nr:hypothetical protein HK098_001488 [Nowakowskiella sp. JEL0407]
MATLTQPTLPPIPLSPSPPPPSPTNDPLPTTQQQSPSPAVQTTVAQVTTAPAARTTNDNDVTGTVQAIVTTQRTITSLVVIRQTVAPIGNDLLTPISSAGNVSVTPNNNSSTDAQGGLSAGSIAGISIGAIFLFAIMGVAFFMNKQREKPDKGRAGFRGSAFFRNSLAIVPQYANQPQAVDRAQSPPLMPTARSPPPRSPPPTNYQSDSLKSKPVDFKNMSYQPPIAMQSMQRKIDSPSPYRQSDAYAPPYPPQQPAMGVAPYTQDGSNMELYQDLNTGLLYDAKTGQWYAVAQNS